LASDNRRILRTTVAAICLLVGPTAAIVRAQPPPPAIDLAAGWVGFADDGVVSEPVVGGAMRFPVSPRLSIGPEIVHIQGRHHSHLVMTGNVTFDVRGPRARRPGALRPFLVAGGGVFQTRERFPTGTFTSHDGAFTAGGGLRAAVSDRVALGVECRVGWEPHVRINGLVSIGL
jgi:hypothetical protein